MPPYFFSLLRREKKKERINIRHHLYLRIFVLILVNHYKNFKKLLKFSMEGEIFCEFFQIISQFFQHTYGIHGTYLLLWFVSLFRSLRLYQPLVQLLGLQQFGLYHDGTSYIPYSKEAVYVVFYHVFREVPWFTLEHHVIFWRTVRVFRCPANRSHVVVEGGESRLFFKAERIKKVIPQKIFDK